MGVSTWNIKGLATDNSTVSLLPGSGLAFAASHFGDDVALAAYQSTTHALDGDQSHVCVAVHLNNTQYVSSTQLKINGGATQTISNIVPSTTQVPLTATFSHTAAVAVSNVSVQAYNLTAPETGAIPGINIWALEQGVWTTWKDINGTARTLTAGTGASSYTWRLALSASPTIGNDKLFGLRFSLTWI